VSDTPSEAPAKGGRYHHGDLKAALVDAAISLIAERGVREFSLAEVSRRLGVTVAAPYRHFADRDDLLAAVGIRALDVFAAALAVEARDCDSPGQRLAALARAYAKAADALMAVAEATAHGHAMLLLDGSFDDEEDPVGSAADQAASATLALIQGRNALRRPS
jgi:AcrR family transcriptional regulator